MKVRLYLNRNAHKVKSHPSLQRGGCNEVPDIEDLVKIGQAVKGLASYHILLIFVFCLEDFIALSSIYPSYIESCHKDILYFQVAPIMQLALCQMMHNWYFVLIVILSILSFGEQWM